MCDEGASRRADAPCSKRAAPAVAKSLRFRFPAAPNDVEAMRRVLQDPNIGSFDGVDTLIDPDPNAMLFAINRLFANCQKEDLAVLFFSGHGITDDEGRLYLTTRLTDEQFYKATSVPASFVHDVMNDSRCKVGGQPGEYDREIYKKFCDRLEWYVKGQWLNYYDLTFSLDSPQGHLPGVCKKGWRNRFEKDCLSSLASRLVKCSI